jgi:hypothetical protein
MSNIHHGDLVILTRADAIKFAGIEEVTGSLDIRADASLPVLTSVGGSLYIRADASLPVLTSVGGSLEIRADASLPVLTSVEGHPATLPPICLTLDPWVVCITDDHMRIGCQTHSLHAWEHFTTREIAAMDSSKAVRWWAANKDALLTRAREAGRSFAEPGVALAA